MSISRSDALAGYFSCLRVNTQSGKVLSESEHPEGGHQSLDVRDQRHCVPQIGHISKHPSHTRKREIKPGLNGKETHPLDAYSGLKNATALARAWLSGCLSNCEPCNSSNTNNRNCEQGCLTILLSQRLSRAPSVYSPKSYPSYAKSNNSVVGKLLRDGHASKRDNGLSGIGTQHGGELH